VKRANFNHRNLTTETQRHDLNIAKDKAVSLCLRG
jgi:hypothetical protein